MMSNVSRYPSRRANDIGVSKQSWKFRAQIDLDLNSLGDAKHGELVFESIDTFASVQLVSRSKGTADIRTASIFWMQTTISVLGECRYSLPNCKPAMNSFLPSPRLKGSLRLSRRSTVRSEVDLAIWETVLEWGSERLSITHDGIGDRSFGVGDPGLVYLTGCSLV